MTALATLLGATAGLGMVILLAGWRGTPPTASASAPRIVAWWRAWPHANTRLAIAVGVGVLVGAGTGWPVAALLAAAALVLPGWLTEASTQAEQADRHQRVAQQVELLPRAVALGEPD
ncbi:MAG: hypothetical protein ACRDNS_02550, partial [Trebonia sp.]